MEYTNSFLGFWVNTSLCLHLLHLNMFAFCTTHTSLYQKELWWIFKQFFIVLQKTYLSNWLERNYQSIKTKTILNQLQNWTCKNCCNHTIYCFNEIWEKNCCLKAKAKQKNNTQTHFHQCVFLLRFKKLLSQTLSPMQLFSFAHLNKRTEIKSWLANWCNNLLISGRVTTVLSSYP